MILGVFKLIIESCKLCPRECGGYRDDEIGKGICGARAVAEVARIAPHFGEEPCISGTRGSGAVFFSRCVMKCLFCQNYDISHGGFGKAVTAGALAEKYKTIYKPSIPIVFNCGGYEKPESLKLLQGLVDVYLPDFKYADDELAYEYSGVRNYKETAERAIAEMIRQTGKPRFGGGGMITGGTVIRHLVLPSATKNSIEVLKTIKARFGDSVLVSLMAQYTPCGEALAHKKLSRKITAREYQRVLDTLFELDLDGYAQELESSGEEFIPDFDLTGV